MAKAPEPTPKKTANPDPFGPTGRRDVPPFIVDGIDPASGANPDADKRLAWLEAQQDAMNGRKWTRPE